MDTTSATAVTNTAKRSKEVCTIPPAPPEVVAVLTAGLKSTRFVYPSDGSIRAIEVWEPPVVADKAIGTAIWLRLQDLEAHTAPAEPGRLMSRVLVLLSHYRQASHSDVVEQGIADDWADDLGCFPMWAIDEAARRWRKSKKFRPQIAEMLDLCEEATREAVKERDRLRKILEVTKASKNPLVERTRLLTRTLLKVVD